MIEVLVRSSKRNPVLLGPAGVGKTAIVEGLAQRIVAGRVPAPLLGVADHRGAARVAHRRHAVPRPARGARRPARRGGEPARDHPVLRRDPPPRRRRPDRGRDGRRRGPQAGPVARRHRGHRRHDPRGVPDHDRPRRGARPAVHDRRPSRSSTGPPRGRSSSSVRDALAAEPRRDRVRRRARRPARLRRPVDRQPPLPGQGDRPARAGDRPRDRRRADDRRSGRRGRRRPSPGRPGRRRRRRSSGSGATSSPWPATASSGPIVGPRPRARRDHRGPAAADEAQPAPARTGRLGQDRDRRGPRHPDRGGQGPGRARATSGSSTCRSSRWRRGIAAEPPLLGDLLVEVRHPSVVVFFDEIHLLASPTVRDLAESLKPALARGEIACIGATTAEEYQADLESETALARRFTEIPIEPMDEAAVHVVLVAVRDSLARLRGITVDDAALDELVALADQFLPNRAFPDKGVDLIEQSVAYAITHGRKVVDVATAREAVAALIGMPLDPTASLAALATELRERALLDPAAAAALLGRLGVSLRGLDARRERPDAVVLLCDGAAAAADVLGRDACADRLRPRHGRDRHRPLGDDRRLVDLDAARLGARAHRLGPAAAAPRAAPLAVAGRRPARHRQLCASRSATRSPPRLRPARSPTRWAGGSRSARRSSS